MATDAIIILERLRCIRESDGTGHSEPYIWPVLMWIDNNTLATPELVGVTDPALGNARVVIKSDMRAGQTADIPNSPQQQPRWRCHSVWPCRHPPQQQPRWRCHSVWPCRHRAGVRRQRLPLNSSRAGGATAFGRAGTAQACGGSGRVGRRERRAGEKAV